MLAEYFETASAEVTASKQLSRKAAEVLFYWIFRLLLTLLASISSVEESAMVSPQAMSVQHSYL